MSAQSLEILNEGIRYQRAGFRMQAAKLYRRVPKGDRYHGDALNLLGTLRFEQGMALDAARLIGEAVRVNPRNTTAWGNLGRVLKHLALFDKAAACFRRAALLAPERPDGVAGLSQVTTGTELARTLRRRLALSPLDVDGLIEFGNDRSRDGDKAGAAERFRRVLVIDPRSFAGMFNLGNAVRDLGQSDAAAWCYERSLVLDPGNANVLNNRGLLAFNRADWATAERWFRKAVGAYGLHAAGWSNLARSLQKQGRDQAAVDGFRRGLAIDPRNMPVCCEFAGLLELPKWARFGLVVDPLQATAYNRLALLATKDPTRRAVMPWLRRGACMRPDDPDTWYNIGVELGRSGDAEAAAKYGWLATRVRDNHAFAHLNTALALLVLERFEPGWEEHRRRVESAEAAPFMRYFDIPEWIDQDLAGRRLLVWGEQGIGDEIQFMTLIRHLIRRGARLTVLTEPRIRPIVRRSLPGVAVPDVADPSGKLEDHHGCDMHVALGDLPHRLRLFCGGTERPEPWIVPDPDRVARLRAGLLERHPGKRLVGITWRSVAPKTGGRRTVPIELWGDFAATPGVAVVSLQYGLKQQDLDDIAALGCDIDHAHGVEPIMDLDGLAALVAAVDLVVCPPNNTVHFAGAMAKPCWVMVPTRPDWRWGLTRSDSLWYPNTRVFRQESDDDWMPVMRRVADALRAWAGEAA
ncbi:protein FlbA [Thalassobaculum fulvum]|uniref:Protein FlbA n=1 Tax=Thalassobaculum fulvum TaxID=1633335 RepID=A0A919CRZ7_9PROT|nr:tetratricopeptide repeat protein [Thalassobaculum fulvum]GHD60300.1 protein FlbA [Thalassobaculum fulvum]